MLGLTFRPSAHPEQPTLWRTAMLPIPGSKPIIVALSSDKQGCSALAAAMLCMGEDELEIGMIDDFLRELLNMTAGQLKRDLALNQQALGLPKIFDGETAFATKPADWSHYVLDANSIRLVVSLAAGVF
jgi:hypothetical protein